MSSLTMVEKRKLENILGMASGYVLDFSNKTFAELFNSVCGINIYDPLYSTYGDSKGKRLRAFWEIEQDCVVGKVLKEMLQFSRLIQSENGLETNASQLKECEAIVSRLSEEQSEFENTEDSFLKIQFEKVAFATIDVDLAIIPLLEMRLNEAMKCRQAGAYLSVIFMCGSILEGLLLGVAMKKPKEFNQTNASPKNDGKVKPFQDWKLGEFIDVANEVGLLSLDIKKFSHALRDFRNYIHPYSQMVSRFSPDEHTADICLQVLKAAIASLRRSLTRKGTLC